MNTTKEKNNGTDAKVFHLLNAISTSVQSSKAPRWSVLTTLGGEALVPTGGLAPPTSPQPTRAGRRGGHPPIAFRGPISPSTNVTRGRGAGLILGGGAQEPKPSTGRIARRG